MKFKFYPKISRIYDFLEFPTLAFSRESIEKVDENLKDEILDDYLELVQKVENKLKPFKDNIEKFYIIEHLNDYDFIDLISKVYSIFDYENENEYLDMLLTLSEEEINKAIVYSLIRIDEEYKDGYSEQIMNRAESICENKEEIINIIKNLPNEPASKWSLFLMVEDPVKHMNDYVNLMRRIEPIYGEIYSLYEAEVREYGEGLVEFLNREGAKGLEEITFSVMRSNILDPEKNNILISITSSFAVALTTTGKDRFAAWGLKVEKLFKAMKDLYENKINERVQIFKNLGDKTRYEVLKLIASGETSNKKIAKEIGVSSATISYHLNNLVTAKIIKLDKSDNKYGYIVDQQYIDEIFEEFKQDIKPPHS